MAQATNNNLKVWFEFRGGEFGLAPLTVEEANLRFWSVFFLGKDGSICHGFEITGG